MKIKCVDCGRYAVHLAPHTVPRPERLPYCRDCGPTRGTPLPKVGEGMYQAVRIVWETEHCTKLHVAVLMAGGGSRAYGYRVIDRATSADLVNAKKDGSRYILTTTRLGRAILGLERSTR